MRFEIDPLPDETLKACQALVAMELPPSRWPLILLGVYGLVVAASFAFARSTMPATVFIGIGSVMLALTLWERYNRARTGRLLGRDTHGRERHFIEVDAEGVRAWCSHAESRYSWTDFTAVSETKDFILLRRSGGNGSAIPKRLLDDASDAAIRASLRQWVAEDKLHFARVIR
jgi:hypothetical protein